MFFSGKNLMVTNSFKLSSITVEGTQLQIVGALDGMMTGQIEKKVMCRFNSMMKLDVK